MARFRALARRRVRGTSLRAVARQVGLTPTGLSKILNGSNPQSATLSRLRSWYVWQEEQPTALDSHEALAALLTLTSVLPAPARPDRALEVLAVLREGFGDAVPPWWMEFEQLAESVIQSSTPKAGTSAPDQQP